jgi:hypothetical protein
LKNINLKEALKKQICYITKTDMLHLFENHFIDNWDHQMSWNWKKTRWWSEIMEEILFSWKIEV